jgi:hypothetical protein
METESLAPLTPRRRWTWIVFAACLSLSLIFQLTRGAWNSDLGGDPDEAAHAVTSLMVRDYLAGGWRQPPMSFARRFYDDFPKVALGHYPPGYYILAGLWLLPSASAQSLLVLQAVLSAVLGTLLFRIASKFASLTASIMAGVVMTVLPISLKQVQLVMSDTLVTILCLWATLVWADYLNQPSKRKATWFGLIAATAILTKGSALALCALPPLTVLFTRRWKLLKNPSWWLSALPVLVLAGPWMAYSAKITADGMDHSPLRQFIPEAVVFYADALPHVMGWMFILLSIAGLIRLVIWMKRVPGAQAHQAAAFCALVGGMCLIILLIPAGLTTRYLLTLISVLVVIAAVAADWIGGMFSRFRSAAVSIIMVGSYALVADWPEKRVEGFRQAVTQAGLPQPGAEPSSWLISSDARGEGAIIAAAAFECPRRSPSPLRLYRGSKELASSDWMGRGYASTFTDEGRLLDHLDQLKIRRVFLDRSAGEAQRKTHERFLEQSLRLAPERWVMDFEQTITRSRGSGGKLLVYKRL